MIVDKINQHLDKVESIKEDIKKDVEKIVKNIDIKILIKKPDATLKILQDTILILAAKKYIGQVIKEGKRFAADVSVEYKKEMGSGEKTESNPGR